MSPKTSTIILSLLSFILASVATTLSSATADNGCPGNSVPKILKHYGIPGGLFPDYVQEFSCEPIDNDNTALRLKIQLQGSCNVTREFGIKNIVACQPEISAVISRDELTDVSGVTVTLFFLGQPVGELMTISAVKIMPDPIFFKSLQFFSKEGVNSPKFPIMFFPNKPPTCDRSGAAAAFGYSDESAGVDVVPKNAAKWVYNYGRLLPLVAA